MGKITRKKLEKHFKGVFKKKRKKKALGKEIEERVKSIAIEQLEAHGDDGLDRIVIDNVSIEILSENPESTARSLAPEPMATAAAASSNCFYVCFVLGGKQICRKVCW